MPNCGKTTLFNLCTGAELKTANFAGVTVEAAVREGREKYGLSDCRFTDLPGLYSLTCYTPEEKAAAGLLLDGSFDLVVQVASAVSPARSLYLCLQLLEAGIVPILALNLFDEAERRGLTVNCSLLSELLGVPVYPISAKKAVKVKGKKSENSKRLRAFWRAIGESSSSLQDKGDKRKSAGERRSPFFKRHLSDEEKYKEIDRIIRKCVAYPEKEKTGDRIDRVLLHPVFGIPLFFVFQAAVLFLTYRLGNVLTDLLSSLLEAVFRILGQVLDNAGCAPPLVSLLTNGIGKGIGSVLSFLPFVLLLCLFLALLEDSGYLPRTAYLFDRILRLAGLSGKALLPLLLGFGCTVPAILAARILENEKERKRCIFLLPFVCCSARLPVLLYIVSRFFEKPQTVLLFLFYFAGIAIAWMIGRMVVWAKKRAGVPIEASFLLTELPDYHLPSLSTALRTVKGQLFDTLKRACGVVFLFSLLLWIAESYGPAGYCAGQPALSFAGMFARFLLPLFRPIGLAYPEIVSALPAGIAAKETMIAAMEISLGERGIAALLSAGFGKANALSLLCFALFYTPCAATLAVIRKETGKRRYALLSALWQLLIAYVTAFLVYQGWNLLTLLQSVL